MKKQDNPLVIGLIVLLVVLLFGGFGIMGFGGFGMKSMMGGYGNSYLCSQVGGIWCYWPSTGFLSMFIFWSVVILLIVLIVKHFQKRGAK